MNLENEYLSEKEAVIFLKLFTGLDYSFALVSSRKWGNSEKAELEKKTLYYQIMPDGSDDGFFDWYVNKRPYKQFFESRETCIIHFLNYRKIWLDLKPDPKQ